jgi:hypothetical protein
MKLEKRNLGSKVKSKDIKKEKGKYFLKRKK